VKNVDPEFTGSLWWCSTSSSWTSMAV